MRVGGLVLNPGAADCIVGMSGLFSVNATLSQYEGNSRPTGARRGGTSARRGRYPILVPCRPGPGRPQWDSQAPEQQCDVVAPRHLFRWTKTTSFQLENSCEMGQSLAGQRCRPAWRKEMAGEGDSGSVRQKRCICSVPGGAVCGRPKEGKVQPSYCRLPDDV